MALAVYFCDHHSRVFGMEMQLPRVCEGCMIASFPKQLAEINTDYLRLQGWHQICSVQDKGPWARFVLWAYVSRKGSVFWG
jgi:hypothetical protein